MSTNNFRFFTPLEDLKKSNESEKDVYFFKGKASDSSKDSDGESLSPDIFDFSEFKYVNWDHGKQPSDIIGEKTSVSIVNREVLVEGIIYNQGKGKDTIELMKKLRKSPNGYRLGISVEGEVLERDLLTKMPTRAKVTSIAICPFPKNGTTWAELLEKSRKGESLYQTPEVLEYEEPGDSFLLDFTDEKGNTLQILKDFSFKVKKSQTTENSSALIKESVEETPKKALSLVNLVKAHKNKQIGDEILEKIKENLEKSL